MLNRKQIIEKMNEYGFPLTESAFNYLVTARILPPSMRSARKAGGEGSEGVYAPEVLDFLQVVFALRSKGFSYPAIRGKLIAIAQRDVEAKRRKALSALDEAQKAETVEEMKKGLELAKTAIEEFENEEQLSFEAKLRELSSDPETKLKFLLSRDIPSKVAQWKR